MTLYAEVNPVPSVDELGLVAESPTEYLATLDARSSEVIQLKTREDQSTDRMRPVMPWLAVAVLAIVAGVAIVLMTDDESADVVDTPPPTIVESAPTSLATPTTVADKLADYPVWIGNGPGLFKAAVSPVPYAFTVPAGWWSGGQAEDRLAIFSPPEAAAPAALVAVLKLEVGTVDETRDYLATFDGAVVGDSDEASLGGAEGIRFEFTHEVPINEPGGGFNPDLPVPPVAVNELGGQIPLGEGPLGRSIIWIVDVAGETMVVAYQGKDLDRGSLNDGFNDHLEEGMVIIDSIVWGDLP